MNVAELIKRLQELPPEETVIMCLADGVATDINGAYEWKGNVILSDVDPTSMPKE